MVLKLEQFNLEKIGTKNTMKLLRYLTLKPYQVWGLTEISDEIKVSKSNVLRILQVLRDYNIIIEHKSSRKKLFQINSELELVKELWKLFMVEKKYNLPPNFKNSIDLFYNETKDDLELFILFGSVAQGLSTEKSDIDLLVVSNKDLNTYKYDFLPHRFEIHHYSWEDIINPVDFVVLEALFEGIVYKGEVFELIANIRSFPKDYMVYRLEKAREFDLKSKSYPYESAEYFKQLAEITVGELKSIMGKGTTTPKRTIQMEDIASEIEELEMKLSKEGEKVWLH